MRLYPRRTSQITGRHSRAGDPDSSGNPTRPRPGEPWSPLPRPPEAPPAGSGGRSPGRRSNGSPPGCGDASP